MRTHLFHLIAWACLVLGVAIEAKIMETPIENTVTDFELAEEGLSVVLTNAIEDARELVEYLQMQHDVKQLDYMAAQFEKDEKEAEVFAAVCERASSMQFRAMRVLGLLQAAREREAGKIT